MKRTVTLLLMALALVSGLTQCKKNVETLATGNLGETVHIKVNVGNGSRYEIYPGTGAVVYTAGDKIFVGDGSKYLGTLTYASGAFSGDITKPAAGVYLHFYFASGLATTPATLTAGTTSYTVNIAGQGSKLPVLSYGKSTSTYTDENATYGCTLLNKCALVNVTLTEGTNATVTIAGMNTTATIDFATPGITPTATTGAITLYSESETSKWAILLPQNAVDDATVTIGGADYTVDIPEITANGYLAGANALAIDNTAVDYVFSVDGSGTTVHFAPANLQYTKSTDTWSFMEHAYTIIETDGQDVGDSYADQDVVSLFTWGANGANSINPYDTDDGYWDGVELGDNDWAVRANEANLDGHNDWHTLTFDQWEYILNHSTNGWSTVAGVNGYVLRPDGNTTAVASSYTAEAWAVEEASGSVFLPAAGCRYSTGVENVGYDGNYWTSSTNDDDYWAVYVNVSADGGAYQSINGRDNGYSVRLVR